MSSAQVECLQLSTETVQRQFNGVLDSIPGLPWGRNFYPHTHTHPIPTANLQYTQLVKYPHTSTSTRQQYSSTAEVPVQVPVLQPCSSMLRIEVESLFQMTGPICPLPRSSAPWLGLCLGLRVMVTVRVGV